MMDKSEKKSETRLDAAQTLGVSYEATPEQATAAYRHRLTQRFYLTGLDKDSRDAGDQALYDAKQLMQYSPSQQWRAQVKSALTPKDDKFIAIYLDTIACLRSQQIDPADQIVLGEILKTLKSIQRQSRIFNAIVAYQFTGLGGMFAYDHIADTRNSAVGLVVYGSMIVGVGAIAFIMDSMRRKRAELKGWLKLIKMINRR